MKLGLAIWKAESDVCYMFCTFSLFPFLLNLTTLVLSNLATINFYLIISLFFQLLPPHLFPSIPNRSKVTMEEVWKDISITPIPDHIIHNPIPNPTSHFKAMVFQDFFNTKNPSTMASQIIKPTTQEFQFFENQMINNFQLGLNADHHNHIPSLNALASSSGSDFNGGLHHDQTNKKRLSVYGGCEDEEVCVDRRHKRMIKNRESAARSRARKQAYITELELEVANLTAENALLRKQQRQIIEDQATPVPKKHGLYRTLTAPF